jgi:hypothetical protein
LVYGRGRVVAGERWARVVKWSLVGCKEGFVCGARVDLNYTHKIIYLLFVVCLTTNHQSSTLHY